MGDFVAAVAILVPIFIAAMALRWVRMIRLNSEKQIEQNQEIIALLKESIKENRQ